MEGQGYRLVLDEGLRMLVHELSQDLHEFVQRRALHFPADELAIGTASLETMLSGHRKHEGCKQAIDAVNGSAGDEGHGAGGHDRELTQQSEEGGLDIDRFRTLLEAQERPIDVEEEGPVLGKLW
jgi:hypothetical protein